MRFNDAATNTVLPVCVEEAVSPEETKSSSVVIWSAIGAGVASTDIGACDDAAREEDATPLDAGVCVLLSWLCTPGLLSRA